MAKGSKPESRRLTLSAGIAEIERELTFLASYVSADALESESVCRLICDLNELMDVFAEPMRKDGELFATVGDVGDVVTICGRTHPSAHHAVFEQARSFLDRLRFHVDDEHRKETTKASSGLNPERVSENWERAKGGIEELLHEEWRQDFFKVRPRLERERAALRAKRGANIEWITLAQAAALAQTPGGTISRAADRGEIEDNGVKGRGRLFNAEFVAKYFLRHSE